MGAETTLITKLQMKPALGKSRPDDNWIIASRLRGTTSRIYKMLQSSNIVPDAVHTPVKGSLSSEVGS
jgi:hypothetical protein